MEQNLNITHKPRRRGGRPAMLDQDKRAVCPRPGFTLAEWARVEARAEAAGVAPVEFIRSVSLNQQIQALPVVNREVLIELSRIGNNINQIAHRLNAGALASLNADQISDWLAQVQTEIRRIGGACHGNVQNH